MHFIRLQGYFVFTPGFFFFSLGSASPQSPLWTSRPCNSGIGNHFTDNCLGHISLIAHKPSTHHRSLIAHKPPTQSSPITPHHAEFTHHTTSHITQSGGGPQVWRYGGVGGAQVFRCGVMEVEEGLR